MGTRLRLCSIPGCDKPEKARTWCSAHYSRWWRYGNVRVFSKHVDAPTRCKVTDCSARAVALARCTEHYRGVLDRDSASRPSRFQRFWRKVDPNGPESRPGLGPCWVWTAATRDGYGRFCAAGASHVSAHRFAYELFVGPIPDGVWVLHRCDRRSCVRPGHLFLGTATDNVRDMFAKGRSRYQDGAQSDKPVA